VTALLDDSVDLAEPRHVVVAERRRRAARSSAVCVVLAGLAFLLFCLSLSLGSFPVPLGDVVTTLFGQGAPEHEFIVTELRLPRAVTAVLVGASFGISGAIFQTMVRNPLASPDIIGITSGASAAAVVAIVATNAGATAISGSALAGGVLTAVAIYALAWRKGVSGYRLVLVGIGIAAMLTSVVSYLLTQAELHTAAEALTWLTGSLNAKTWDSIGPLLVVLPVLIVLGLLCGRGLRSLQVDDDTAKSLGVHVERNRLGLMLLAVALAAVATSAAGPVQFVAFVSAPIARRLVGGSALALLPSALVGCVVVLAADLIGQHTLDVQLPVGIVTGIVGAPYLIWLLTVSNRRGVDA
jgi:iron complex transport system permease protein